MNEGIAYRHGNVSTSFVAKCTVPLGLLVAIVVLSLIRPMALAITLTGLIFDALGAVTLGFGILSATAARVRMWRKQSEEPIGRLPWWSRWCVKAPVALSNRFAGSTLSTSSSDIEDVADTFWGLVLLAVGFVGQAFGAWLQAAPMASGGMWGVWRSPLPSSSVGDATTVLYALSTIAQTCAALAAFVGAIGIFHLQRLHDERGRLEPIIRTAMFEIHGHDPAIYAYPMTRITEWFLKTASAPDPQSRNSAAEALMPQVNAWAAIPGTVSRSRRALIAFEAWNLSVIGVTLLGFSLVSTLAAVPLLATMLLCLIVVGTVVITLWCVVVWTKS